MADAKPDAAPDRQSPAGLLSRFPRLRRFGLPFALGLVIATGQAPLSLALVALAGLIGVFAVFASAATPRAAAITGWAAGFGYFIGALFWIVEPFLVEPLRHGWMAPFALVLLPGGLALFWGAAFSLAARLATGGRRLFLGAVLLAAVEASRAYVLTGFPWALLGYLWIDTPQMQLAAVIGPHGLTLVTTLIAALCLIRPTRWYASWGLALALVAAMSAWGMLRLRAPLPEPPGITLRIVQPNAEQHLKWDYRRAEEFLGRLYEATSTPPLGAKPDLVFWPETAVPYLLNGAETTLAEIATAADGTPVVFGVARLEAGRYYNSLAVTEPGGSVAQLYDKHHLVPFGEYLPFGELAARFGLHGLAASEGGGFTPGPGPRVLDLGAAGKMLPLICYEAIFPQDLRAGERADWVLHITNDAWFGEISGPYQHLAQARLRAVEQGLPVVRAANTGISAVIDPKGRVIASLGLGKRGFIDSALPAPLPATPYARTGDWPSFVAMLLLLALAIASPIRRKPD